MWCQHKSKLSRDLTKAIKSAQKLANKHQKSYRIYQCEYCGYHHLTTWTERQEHHQGEILATVDPD